MSELDSIKKAILDRIPISFNYIREGKDPGVRVGNPYAVFIKRLKSGEEKIYLHLVQTSGATDSDTEFPSWRQFFINEIVNVHLLNEKAPFEIASDYNPTFYEFPIAKI